MRPKCSVFIATSLDGFIARSDGRIDWLDEANRLVPAGEDCGFAKFFASVDALVIGRVSFETVLQFPEWPYGSKPVYVLTRSLIRLPPNVPGSVQLLTTVPEEVVRFCEARGHQHLYIDGGKTIQGFLSAGLIDELTITVIPVLLGEGIPLFGKLPSDLRLKHVFAHPYPFGFVQNHYAVR
jgi:dihydrofolate reductase